MSHMKGRGAGWFLPPSLHRTRWWPARARRAIWLPMARSKQLPEFEIEVEGEAYLWRLQRIPQWSSDTAGWRGMAIAARHAEGQREVVMEFPAGPQPRFG